MDLAAGQLSALRLLDGPKCFAVNLGTGEGSSGLEVVRAFEAGSGRNIPYEVKPRRPGDIGACYAAPDHASKLMNLRAPRVLGTLCAHHCPWPPADPHRPCPPSSPHGP